MPPAPALSVQEWCYAFSEVCRWLLLSDITLLPCAASEKAEGEKKKKKKNLKKSEKACGRKEHAGKFRGEY